MSSITYSDPTQNLLQAILHFFKKHLTHPWQSKNSHSNANISCIRFPRKSGPRFGSGRLVPAPWPTYPVVTPHYCSTLLSPAIIPQDRITGTCVTAPLDRSSNWRTFVVGCISDSLSGFSVTKEIMSLKCFNFIEHDVAATVLFNNILIASVGNLQWRNYEVLRYLWLIIGIWGSCTSKMRLIVNLK